MKTSSKCQSTGGSVEFTVYSVTRLRTICEGDATALVALNIIDEKVRLPTCYRGSIDYCQQDGIEKISMRKNGRLRVTLRSEVAAKLDPAFQRFMRRISG